jgi:NAD(P)-dependent dehydrogenase (short-subunit alcohol dehydrogenase family)
MSSSPTLKDKNAIVFGAGGSIGAAVAKEFATEGGKFSLPAGLNRTWKR